MSAPVFLATNTQKTIIYAEAHTAEAALRIARNRLDIPIELVVLSDRNHGREPTFSPDGATNYFDYTPEPSQSIRELADFVKQRYTSGSSASFLISPIPHNDDEAELCDQCCAYISSHGWEYHDGTIHCSPQCCADHASRLSADDTATYTKE